MGRHVAQEEKDKIAKEAIQNGVSFIELRRRYGYSDGAIARWTKEYCQANGIKLKRGRGWNTKQKALKKYAANGFVKIEDTNGHKLIEVVAPNGVTVRTPKEYLMEVVQLLGGSGRE